MADNFEASKDLKAVVERYESVDGELPGKPMQEPAAMGTVVITDMHNIFLIPAPSADPQGSSARLLNQKGPIY